MFDLSFFELLVIGAVALVVIGPERLPRVARTAGQWVGKIQRYVSDVKNDINREMEIEELRRLRAEMNETARSVEATALSMENSLRQQASLDLDEPAANAGEAAAPAGAADETLAAIPSVPSAEQEPAPEEPPAVGTVPAPSASSSPQNPPSAANPAPDQPSVASLAPDQPEAPVAAGSDSRSSASAEPLHSAAPAALAEAVRADASKASSRTP
ncbi:MAG: Sec-independent protein translocase protein TatB [Pigmentiphaga sp.]|nr:Sec-independent protein translocase protein TatB [Pigmentiphaga sp.]